MQQDLFDRMRNVYTVSELTRNIKLVLEKTYPEVWVEGEVSNLSCPSSGHIYFTLKDESAELRAVCFKPRAINLKFRIENGLSLVCFGRLSVYETRGQYQLYVEKLEPMGLGALQLAFEQLKKRLAREGLFEEAHKLPIPYLPTRIGVVTSSTGAAIRDILNVLKRRYTNVEILINPAKVQGEDAKEEIKEAIEEFNEFGEVDVLIVGRGGGSLEDLWAFNEEVVARAIYKSRIPIISAVGHEIDWTISDMVADKRAPTPSAAAEIVIPRKEELVVRVRDSYSRLNYTMLSKVSQLTERFKALGKRLLLSHPSSLILQYEQRLDEMGGQLHTHIVYYLRLMEEKIKGLGRRLEAVSPIGVLSRGYSITMKDGVVIKETKKIRRGDSVITKLFRGTLVSEVKEIEDERDKI